MKSNHPTVVYSHQPKLLQCRQYELPTSSSSPSPPLPSSPPPYSSTTAPCNQLYFPVQQSPFHSVSAQPMKHQSNVSNEASKRQLPQSWKPFGCCGISNASWTLLILILILVYCFIDFALYMKYMVQMIQSGDLLAVVELIFGVWALLHAIFALVALIQIREGNAFGLSALLKLLFMDYFIKICLFILFVLSIFAVDYLSSISRFRYESLEEYLEWQLDLKTAFAGCIFYANLQLIEIFFIFFSRKVLIDYRKEMRMTYMH